MEKEKRLLLTYDLQRFAKDGPGGEKTEPATAKKLTDARKEGKVEPGDQFCGRLDRIISDIETIHVICLR